MHHWNISSVIHDLDTITITGYCSNDIGTVLNCTITKTTLQNALNEFNHNYNEGHALSIVNPDLVYIIDVMFDIHKYNTYDNMKNRPFEPADNLKYFDGEYYMGLPAIVFMQWKSMISIEL